jgi:hypothetical protein
MIPLVAEKENISGGIEKTVGFSVKRENFAHLFHILRSQTYSDPILAVLREYATNACDAHTEAGKPDEPIQVSLPTVLDCFLKIRDFGTGLTDEEIQEVYASYGESTKRHSQAFNGMLGIGCKSGFSYQDSFMVNSYKDGTMTIWNAYIDESNEGKMAKMGEASTEEPNGVEIVIPVKHDDINKFREKAFFLYSFFRIKPALKNVTPDDQSRFDNVCAKTPMYSGQNWTYYGDSSPSYAVMGNVPYPISTAIFTDAELSKEVKEIFGSGLVLRFNIGELEFAASREALQYTPFTKKSLLAAMEAMRLDLLKSVTQNFANCQSLWDAKCLLNEVFETTGKLHRLRHLLKGHLDFKGKKISHEKFFSHFTGQSPNAVQVSIYQKEKDSYGYTRDRVTRQTTDTIIASRDHLVCYNDKDIVNGILNRVVGLIETGKCKKVYVLKFLDDASMQAWLKDSEYDGPMARLSDLPKENLSKYYPSARASGVYNPKHASMEFKYVFPARSASKSSDYWEKESVDTENGNGVYFEIERFDICDASGYPKRHSDIQQILLNLNTIGITVPVIYGFKKASDSLEASKKNTKFQRFWEWYDKVVTDFVAQNPELEQAWVDQTAYKNMFAQCSGLNDLLLDKSIIWSKDKNAPINLFIEAVRKMKPDDQTAAKLNCYAKLIQSVKKPVTFTKKTSADLAAQFTKVSARYPLLFECLSVASYNMRYRKAFRDGMIEYLLLIDMVTP